MPAIVDTPQTNPGWFEAIQGNKRGTDDQWKKVLAARVSTVYESKEGSVGVVSNVDLSAQSGFTSLFSTVKIAYRVVIRPSQDIVVRFNDDANDPITVEAGTALDWDFVEVTSIFITTTATTAVRVALA